MAVLSDIAFSTPGRRRWPEEPRDLATLSAILLALLFCLIYVDVEILIVNKIQVFRLVWCLITNMLATVSQNRLGGQGSMERFERR